MRRTALLTVGTLSTAVGVGLLFRPSLVDGVGPLALAGVVVVLLVVVGTSGVSRLSTLRRRPDPPRTGETAGARVPGDDFDRRLESVSAHSDRDADERAAVRARLEALAVDRIVAETGCTRERARERLEDGTWTDDPVAGALFTDESPSTSAYLRALFGGKSAFRRRVEHVIAALAEDEHGG